MSNITKVTRHPNTKHYELAEWRDDYFAPHRYGVKFPNDPVIYPAEQVNEAQLKTWWGNVETQGHALRDSLRTLRRSGDSQGTARQAK